MSNTDITNYSCHVPGDAYKRLNSDDNRTAGSLSKEEHDTATLLAHEAQNYMRLSRGTKQDDDLIASFQQFQQMKDIASKLVPDRSADILADANKQLSGDRLKFANASGSIVLGAKGWNPPEEIRSQAEKENKFYLQAILKSNPLKDSCLEKRTNP